MRSRSLSISNLEKNLEVLLCGEPPSINLTALFWRDISFLSMMGTGYVDPQTGNPYSSLE